MSSAVVDMSSSMSVFVERKDPGSHFRWDSIKKFIYIAAAYSNSIFHFDMFSKITFPVSVYDVIVLQCLLGVPYLFMDFFIKVYTKKIEALKLLSPLMRCVIYCAFLQTFLWSILHSLYGSDTMNYLFISIRTEPAWSKCPKENTACTPAAEIHRKCQLGASRTLDINQTSTHIYYMETLVDTDKSKSTRTFFSLSITWVVTFFLTTVTDQTMVKIFKAAFMFKTLSTVVIVIFLYLMAESEISIRAFQDIFQASGDFFKASFYVASTYGIGYIGLQDFGAVSVFMMVDNAVIIHMLLFTSLGLLRSWVIRVMFLKLQSCVINKEIEFSEHEFLFGVYPLTTELFDAHKLYIYYLYANVWLSCLTYLMVMTVQMARTLHVEFASIKIMYLVGLICSLGFIGAITVAMLHANHVNAFGLWEGLGVMVHFIGTVKVVLIMWIYGVDRFCTDVQFWHGYKPTKYWLITWLCLPVFLVAILLIQIPVLISSKDRTIIPTSVAWICITLFTFAFFAVKTVAKFLARNDLVNIFRANQSYGPPEKEDRKRRRNFDEAMQCRQCTHNCHAFDEMIDCDHMPDARPSFGYMLYSAQDFESKTDFFGTRMSQIH